MRTIKESPVFRVVRRHQHPSQYIVAARDRWKQRVMEERRTTTGQSSSSYHAGSRPEHRRNAVERVLDEDDTIRRRQQQEEEEEERHPEEDEREPDCSESAPLRYSATSSSGIWESSCSSTPSSSSIALHHHQPLSSSQKNSQPLGCSAEGTEKITLIGLLSSSDPMNRALQNSSSGDVHSMDHRFQTMSVARQQHQQRRREQQRSVLQERSVATRRRVLMNTLGMQKYYKALSLVKEIKRLRQKVLISCSPPTSAATNVSSNKSGQQQQRQQVVHLAKNSFEKLPEACRNLLVNTSLVSALEQTNIESLGKLPWGDFLLQAHQNVAAYYEWQSISETRE